ncbi:hypothetical protein AB0O47_39845 [Streptomyces noursei]|uniref:hypothetical protein n=1 Tax=Streptomyces noursei TaxID=1971 RepID=UPI00344C501A
MPTAECPRTQPLTVKLQSYHQPPVTEADHAIARKALVEIAAEDYRLLDSDVTVLHTTVEPLNGMYIALYGAETVLNPAAPVVLTTATAPPRVGVWPVRADVANLRAHQSAQHAAQVLTGAVTDALNPPAEGDAHEGALKALIALHLLGCPVRTNAAVARVGALVDAVFRESS